MLIGYARVSTTGQDLTAQQQQLVTLGVEPANVLVDHGYTGKNRARPGLARALDRLHAGDTLAVTKLDRLARSVADAHAIAQEIEATGARLQIGNDTYDPASPMGALMFNMLATIAQFEADLISARTKEGMEVARQRGHLRGKPPKLTKQQEALVKEWLLSNKMSQREMARTFGVSSSTITRTKQRLIEAGELDPNDLLRDWDPDAGG